MRLDSFTIHFISSYSPCLSEELKLEVVLELRLKIMFFGSSSITEDILVFHNHLAVEK